MNDTDRLIAAIFAATMTARASAPRPREFFGFYDACIAEILEREASDAATKAKLKREAENKAWG